MIVKLGKIKFLTCESPISRFFVEEVRQEWNRIWPRHSLIVTFAYEKVFNKFNKLQNFSIAKFFSKTPDSVPLEDPFKTLNPKTAMKQTENWLTCCFLTLSLQ